MQKAKINAARLVMQSVAGAVRHPSMGNPYRIDHEGVPHILPATGAITYNVKVGDSVYAMECDHVEPGVTVRNPDAQENAAFNTLSCIGNTAIVISGDAKGARGFVTGTHGGVEHVLCYFPEDALDKLAIGDRIQVRAQGQGMKIEGFEDTVFCMNLDPNLFEKMNVTVEDGKLIVPIAARVPASIILQSQSQLKAIYKDAAEIISDNCDCTLFLSGRGKNAKEISDVLGKETIDSYNQSENRGAQTSHGLNYQKLGKELMSQDEIATMDGGKCILQVRGVRPFFSEKYDITRHPRYKYLSDADKKNYFDVDRYLSSLRRKRRRVITEDEPFDLYDIELSEEDFSAE